MSYSWCNYTSRFQSLYYRKLLSHFSSALRKQTYGMNIMHTRWVWFSYWMNACMLQKPENCSAKHVCAGAIFVWRSRLLCVSKIRSDRSSTPGDQIYYWQNSVISLDFRLSSNYSEQLDLHEYGKLRMHFKPSITEIIKKVYWHATWEKEDCFIFIYSYS